MVLPLERAVQDSVIPRCNIQKDPEIAGLHVFVKNINSTSVTKQEYAERVHFSQSRIDNSSSDSGFLRQIDYFENCAFYVIGYLDAQKPRIWDTEEEKGFNNMGDRANIAAECAFHANEMEDS